jgi:hypothetical protein
VNKLRTIFRVLPLVGPLSPPAQEVYVISGKGSVVDGAIQFEDIRSFARVETWTKAYFSENYWDEFFEWVRNDIKAPSFLIEWKKHHETLDGILRSKKNTQIIEAFVSFEEAVKTRRLESKIPSLFRSIECIVECFGKTQFHQRLSSLIGHPTSAHPYGIWQNTNELLVDLYELRNDCAHGKPFAFSLYKKLKGPPPGSLIAKYEFLAEWAARKLIKRAVKLGRSGPRYKASAR